jgi:hypothetical protein
VVTRETPFLLLVSFQILGPFFCTTYFMLFMMGLGPRVLCFFLLGFPIMCSALSGVVFCLNFGHFIFLILFPCRSFFLYLFIYWWLFHIVHMCGVQFFKKLARWTLIINMVTTFLFHKNLKGIHNHVNDHTINYIMEENIDSSNGWGSWQPYKWWW